MDEFKLKQNDPIDIVIVDDKPENLLTLEEVLDEPDLKFTRANSGEEALEACLRCRPALVILDVHMPGMSGFDVARLLRGMERTRHIPIMFVTATHREERFSFEGFEAGAVDYLFKPLNPIVVRSKVRVFVELQRKSIRLERSINELSLVNRELEAFSYSVSHDLRAPVRSVLGFSNNATEMLDKGDLNEARSNLARVVGAGERMNQLIDALLDLSRLTRLQLVKTEVDLSALARGICDELGKENPSKPVAVEIMKEVTALGDRRMLEAALRNLLGNAFKFSSKAESPRIEFGRQIKADKTVYFVRDNGAGFDMAYADRLFGAFQRLHSQDEFQGTGVGLATVQRIVHRHQGRIWPESTKGQGATFYFTLSEI